MANGKEGAVLRGGPSSERKAWKGHDTKRSDWHDPTRLEPVRPHKNHHATTRSHKAENATFPPTDYFKEPLKIRADPGVPGTDCTIGPEKNLVEPRRTSV